MLLAAESNLHIWLPPLWLLGVGAGLGLAILALAFGVVAVVSKRAAAVLVDVAREGFLMPVLLLALTMAVLAIPASFKTPVVELLRALIYSGSPETVDRQSVVVVGHPDEFNFTNRLAELQKVEIHTDHDIIIRPGEEFEKDDIKHQVRADRPWEWNKGTGSQKFFRTKGSIRVEAASEEAATLKIHFEVRSQTPETVLIPGTAIALVSLVGVYLAIRLLAPKTAAVAQATTKEALNQPLFWLLLALGAFAIVVSVYIPYFTFGEDIKMLKDVGMAWIMFLGIALALWTASISVADEIEGRTALTVLSKPLGRRQFIIGKFMGIVLPVLLIFLILGVLFLGCLSYKVVFESREGAQMDPEFQKQHQEWQKGIQSSLNWQYCYHETVSVIPGLVLAFLETVVLTAISVAISTRLPMLPNLVICGTIYVLGHIVPMIGNSKAGDYEIVSKVPVKFVAQFFATVLPVLEHFNTQAAVASGKWIPADYLLWAVVYCALYSGMALLLALFLFEDRDLA